MTPSAICTAAQARSLSDHLISQAPVNRRLGARAEGMPPLPALPRAANRALMRSRRDERRFAGPPCGADISHDRGERGEAGAPRTHRCAAAPRGAVRGLWTPRSIREFKSMFPAVCRQGLVGFGVCDRPLTEHDWAENHSPAMMATVLRQGKRRRRGRKRCWRQAGPPSRCIAALPGCARAHALMVKLPLG
jgi:hypothetical protein